MTETLFSLCNLVVCPAWLLLMVAPNSKWTARATAFGLPFLLGLTYIGLLLTASFGKVDGGFLRLADLARLFENPYMALAGWVHYLAYDLFVGSWQVRDAKRRGIPHLLVVPCLMLTCILGPVGLVCYLLVRWGHGQRHLWSCAIRKSSGPLTCASSHQALETLRAAIESYGRSNETDAHNCPQNDLRATTA